MRIRNVNYPDGNDVNYLVDNLTNRYNTIGDANLSYDSAGNLTADKDGYEYQYDYENRIVKITKDGNDIDEVLCRFGGSFQFYTHDHLYSPVALLQIGAPPTMLERYEYDAYGRAYILEPNFAADPDGKSDYGNPYLFTGRRVDFLDNGSLTLQYNRHRYYDYYTGRWTTQDPYGIDTGGGNGSTFGPKWQYHATINLYEYVSSSPIWNLDPQGLSALSDLPCNIIRNKVDLISAIIGLGGVGAGSEAYYDAVRNLYRTLGQARHLRYASHMMRYWLSGGSDDQKIPKSLILSSSNGETAHDNLINTIKSNVKCKDSTGKCISNGTTTEFSEVVQPSLSADTDLFLATGEFDLKAQGKYKEGWFCKGCDRKLYVYFSMSDPYDWHPGLTVSLCSRTIEDQWAFDLQNHDNLHTFNVVAEWKKKIGCVKCSF